ncbi:MAG: xanthine dehydrogenase family protein molybdopterin-binding subunit, partial [Terriglobia bacterium]
MPKAKTKPRAERAAAGWVGRAMKRKEDPRMIQGLAHYVDDVQLLGMLHVAIVRSPYAHARLRTIDTAAARRAPGVVAVITGKDIAGVLGQIPVAAALPELRVPPHLPLATDRVHFVGEGVAAVVADDRYRARDAAELVDVDYEPLPAVTDPEQALAQGAPKVHEQFPDNQACRWVLMGGNVEKAFRRADRIVRQRFINQRLIPVAIEPRGVVASYDAGSGEVTVWSSTQIPHLLRTQIALMVGIPESQVRVIAPEVGGGFGSKLNVYGEEGLVT